MKKVFLYGVLMIFSGILLSQTAQKPLLAEFRYNDTSFKEAIKNNDITVIVSNLDSDARLTKFKETGGYYSQYFTMSVGEPLKNGDRECKFNYKDNNVLVNILMRFLVSNNVGQIIFDGKSTPIEDFFKNYK